MPGKDTLELLIAEVKNALAERYQERLHKIILFGSYAKEDFHAESDVDITNLPETSARYEVAKSTLFHYVRKEGIEV